ncbi:YegS/Rv2252/BmrU family lipid kinase [Nocardia sp. NBC_00565]|uniref:YegS/Rv2252/BmrU family lipid kinase n=1 Tax=Nocardia sp. NBC_00565 TaxID=2975993 RepID=UPI002E812996|nr:YegS/Rv2252/BmrU family lipid kinase [Nocardia sp. NBC_00565]WUC03815.1 YegS/Rv2252/BmrU family lipid kinase [Nocardia sp. NBC_00565]
MTPDSLRPVRTITVVTNPRSGVGKGQDVAGAALARFAAQGVEVIEVRAPSAAESIRLVRDSIAGSVKPDAVVCIGGDGLMNVVLEAIARTDVPLGLIPAGTGNDLAREIGVPTDDPVAAADLVLGGRTRTIDLGLIESPSPGYSPKWFATVTGTGFDARVTLRANDMRWPKGPLRYTVAALAEISGRFTVPYRIELSGVVPGALDNPDADTVIETEAVMVAIGNTRTYGGGMLVCPDAVMDDGLLDLTVVGAVSRRDMLRLLPALSAGKRIDHPKSKQYRVAQVTLAAAGAPATADGEPAGMLPITLRAVPGALTVLVP